MQAVKAVNKAKKMAASDDETKDDDLLKKIALLVIVEDHYIERLTRSILSDERLTTTNYTDFWNEYNFCMYGPKYATPPPGEHTYNGIKYIYREKTNSQLYNDTSTSLVDACMLHEAFEEAHEAIMKVDDELKKTKQVDNIFIIRAVTAINVAKELVVRRTSEAKKRAITPVSKDVQNDEKIAQNIEGKIKLLDIVIKSMVDALQDDSKTKEDDSKTKEDDSKTKEDNDNGNDDDDDDYSNQIPVEPRYFFMDQFVYAQLAYKKNPSLEAFNKIQTTHAKMNEEGIVMIK